MRAPIAYDLYGDRGLAFSDIIAIVGQDFTGATFAGQVRLFPDAGGSPLVTLTVALGYGGSATVAAHVSALRITADIYNYVNPATGLKYASSDTIAVSLLNVSATAAAMSSPGTGAIPVAAVGLGEVQLAYDILIDPSGAPPQDKWVYGSFFVRGTVTQ